MICGQGFDWLVLFLLTDLPGSGYVNNEYNDGGMEQDRSYGRGRGRGRGGGRGGRGRGGYNGPPPYYEAQQGGDYGNNAAPPADHGYDGPPPQGRGTFWYTIVFSLNKVEQLAMSSKSLKIGGTGRGRGRGGRGRGGGHGGLNRSNGAPIQAAA